MGGYWRQDGGDGALGWDTRQGMGWGSRDMVGFKTGVRFQSCGRIPDTGGVPDRDGGVPDRDGGVPDRNGEIPDRNGGVPDRDGKVPDRGGRVPDRWWYTWWHTRCR